jgi:hypothetical protein
VLRYIESKVAAAVEVQRKKDLEMAETHAHKLRLDLEGKIELLERQRKKDIEKVETQRTKDIERVETQRKKDIERVETQRKKDQSDAHKLKLDLEGKIELLERHANERNLEQKQTAETTKRYIEYLSADIEATTDFLAVGVCLLSIHSLKLVSHIHLYLGRGGVG